MPLLTRAECETYTANGKFYNLLDFAKAVHAFKSADCEMPINLVRVQFGLEWLDSLNNVLCNGATAEGATKEAMDEVRTQIRSKYPDWTEEDLQKEFPRVFTKE